MESDTTTSGGVDRRCPRSIVVIGGAALAGLLLAGCQKPLFPEKSPRSQFETYDTLRLQNQPMEIPDEFGNPTPALRARLTPQD